MDPIVLIGFMGSGKTTLGRALATALGVDFVDLDLELERIHGCSVAFLIERDGEAPSLAPPVLTANAVDIEPAAAGEAPRPSVEPMRRRVHEPNRVAVTVRDEDGRPVPGIEVTIRAESERRGDRRSASGRATPSA